MNSPIKERPILFSGAMVRAILEGRKTQTRRIVKPQPTYEGRDGLASEGWQWLSKKRQLRHWYDAFKFAEALADSCPYGKIGERLWVRECCAWLPDGLNADEGQGRYVYRADAEMNVRWKPSIHMPRAASRILLEIVSVRVERLLDISEEDGIAEGCLVHSECGHAVFTTDGRNEWSPSAYTWFRALWKRINGETSWRSNPWVWVVEFKRVNAA